MNRRITIGSDPFDPAYEDSRFAYSQLERVVLHEIIHAADDLPRATMARGMSAEMGFDESGKNIRVSPSVIAAVSQRRTLVEAMEGKGAGVLAERLAMRGFGYPSVYAVLGGPTECFAELGAVMDSGRCPFSP